MKAKEFFTLMACGIFIGLINGFFGGGGGMICVPVLKNILKLEDKTSHATAIFIMLPISIASAVIYITTGSFEIFDALYITAGVVLGGILGAIVLKKTKNIIINIIFASIMLLAGVRMIL